MKSLSHRRQADKEARLKASRLATARALKKLKASKPLDTMTRDELHKILWFDQMKKRFMWKETAPPPRYTRMRVVELTWRREVKGIFYSGKFYPFDTLLAIYQS